MTKSLYEGISKPGFKPHWRPGDRVSLQRGPGAHTKFGPFPMGRVGGRVAKALAQWAGGRPFCFFARARRVGVEILSSKTGWAWVGARARPALSEVLVVG